MEGRKGMEWKWNPAYIVPAAGSDLMMRKRGSLLDAPSISRSGRLVIQPG